MLTPAGKRRGVAAVVEELDAWHKKNLSKYKWLRGGIQVVDEVNVLFPPGSSSSLPLSILSFFCCSKTNILFDRRSFFLYRSRNPQRVKFYDEFCRIDMRRMRRS